MGISVVTVTYYSEETIEELILSLLHNMSDIISEIIIVDNNSKDNTIKVIENLKNSKIKLIVNQDNLGYRKGVNEGVRLAREDIILVINPDAKLIDDSPRICYNKMIEDNKIVSCSPLMISERFRNVRVMTDFAVPFLLNHAKYEIFRNNLPTGCIINYFVNGASFFVRKDFFEKVGGFDTGIFMYHEEEELSLKIKRNNYISLFCPRAKIFHIGAHSVRKTQGERYKFYLLKILENSPFMYYKYCNDKFYRRLLWWILYLAISLEYTIYTRSTLPLKIFLNNLLQRSNFSCEYPYPCEWNLRYFLREQMKLVSLYLKGNVRD